MSQTLSTRARAPDCARKDPDKRNEPNGTGALRRRRVNRRTWYRAQALFVRPA